MVFSCTSIKSHESGGSVGFQIVKHNTQIFFLNGGKYNSFEHLQLMKF